MMTKFITILILLITTVERLSAQSFIDETKNHIQNKSVLSTFYNKLSSNNPVTILHIGDSHIQANFLTGHLRTLFGRQYGDLSRGLVFPLRLAQTNGHLDIRFYSNVDWQAKRIIDNDNDNVGLSGVSIETDQPQFYIQLINKDFLEMTSLSIIGEGLEDLKIGIPKKTISTPHRLLNPHFYRVKKGDYLLRIAKKHETTVSKLKRWNRLTSDKLQINQRLIVSKTQANPETLNLSDFTLLTPSLQTNTEVTVDCHFPLQELYILKKGTHQTKTKIDAVLLKNQPAKITYHSIGFNGAKYVDYNSASLFFEQLKYVQPDLIIVSLGTNEAFDLHYKIENFYNDATRFIKKVTQLTNCNNVLLTTPPSALIKRKHPNPKLATFSDALIQLSNKNGYAIWDLFAIMGKEDGVKTWYRHNLVAKDRIHFTKAGYKLQAELLFNALLQE